MLSGFLKVTQETMYIFLHELNWFRSDYLGRIDELGEVKNKYAGFIEEQLKHYDPKKFE